MKNIPIILLAALLLSGCSQKHTSAVDLTADIVAGKDIILPGYVINVKKRAGNSLEGIRVVRTEPDGKVTTITAATGTVARGSQQTVDALPAKPETQVGAGLSVVRSTVKLTLFNASIEIKKPSGTTRMTVEKLDLNF